MADIFSFQQIAKYNGWSMAGLGITIDITGLMLLSLVVTQVPKLVALIEKTKSLFEKAPADDAATGIEANSVAPIYDLSPAGIEKIAALYKERTQELGDSFDLTALYLISDKLGLPHPHLTIKSLREAGLLRPDGEHRFAWNF